MYHLLIIPLILFFSSCSFWGITSDRIISHIEIGVNEDFTKIACSDGYCYLASGLNGMRIINVRDPVNPYEISGFRTIDYSEKFYDVDVNNNLAFLVSDGAFYILDISNPDSISEVSSLPIVNSRHIIIEGNYAYIANNLLNIIDISVPGTPVHLPGSIPISSTSSIELKGQYIYSSQGEIIDISDKSSPVQIPNTVVLGTEGITISGNYIYGSSRSSNSEGNEFLLLISDIRNPIDVKHETAITVSDSSLRFGISPAFIESKDNLLFMTTFGGIGLNIFDISNPVELKFKDLLLKSREELCRVVIDGQYIYILSERSFYIVAAY